jgi:hydrogenase small subunit
MGCKGPVTYNNCPAILFGDVGARSWPVGTGSPCFGCSEKGVGFTAPIPSQASLQFVSAPPQGIPPGEAGEVRVGGGALRLTPPQTYAPIVTPEGKGVSATAVGVLAALGGAALGAGAATALKLGQADKGSSETTKED